MHVTHDEGSSIFHLSGVIDETTQFEHHFGTPKKTITLICKEVTRINSVGVKSWIRYFQSLKGVTIIFQECSLAIVEQLNSFSNFASGGTIQSIYLPFLCQNCQHDFVALCEKATLEARQYRVPSSPCPHCQGRAVFDDTDEFFAFARQVAK